MKLAFINNVLPSGILAALAVSCTGTFSGSGAGTQVGVSQEGRERDGISQRSASVPASDDQRAQNARPRAVGGGPLDPAERFTPDVALIKLVTAQCNRELRCETLGPGEKYTSRADCIAKLETERGNQINATNCPREVGGDALRSCLMALENDSCDSAIASTARTNACQLSNLCVK
jgi:Family of unknown function (DUF6184)